MQGDILTNRSAIDRMSTDFYPTPDNVTSALLDFLKLPPNTLIWECACGEGHMVKSIESHGYPVIATELYERGFGETGIDFLKECRPCDWIITNPPFSLAKDFIQHAISLGKPFALLLKSQYWHAEKRLALFEEFKPAYVLPLTWRPDFLFGQKSGSPTMEVHWTVWVDHPSHYTLYCPLRKPGK